MRKGYSYILLLILLCYLGKEAFFLSWFHLDRASFSAQFCENIDAPALECKGQCQIDGLLDDFGEPSPKKETTWLNSYPPTLTALNNSFFWKGFQIPELEKVHAFCKNKYRDRSFSASIFHPPNTLS